MGARDAESDSIGEKFEADPTVGISAEYADLLSGEWVTPGYDPFARDVDEFIGMVRGVPPRRKDGDTDERD